MVGAGVSAVSGVVLVAIITNGFPKELAGTLFAHEGQTHTDRLGFGGVAELGRQVGERRDVFRRGRPDRNARIHLPCHC